MIFTPRTVFLYVLCNIKIVKWNGLIMILLWHTVFLYVLCNIKIVKWNGLIMILLWHTVFLYVVCNIKIVKWNRLMMFVVPTAMAYCVFIYFGASEHIQHASVARAPHNCGVDLPRGDPEI